MRLASPSFDNNGQIPVEFSCQGSDISPMLEFSDIPDGTISLALILHDPDAPNGNWVHWLLWNISPKTEAIDEGEVPTEAIQGTTSDGSQGYHGPCPPSGSHRYIFDLYALDAKLEIPVQATDAELKVAMAGHILAEASLAGLYSKN